jgi:hypothetical protein
MINTLLSLIDRLIQLSQYKRRRYRVLFNEILQPTFDELLLVHKNYIDMFTEAKGLLPREHTQDPSEYTLLLQRPEQHLRNRRIEFEPVRKKLVELAKSLRDKDLNPDVEVFVHAVLSYFSEWIKGGGSSATSLLDTFEASIRKGKEISPDMFNEEWRSIDETIYNLIERHKSLWSDICETYAPLKVRAATSS